MHGMSEKYVDVLQATNTTDRHRSRHSYSVCRWLIAFRSHSKRHGFISSANFVYLRVGTAWRIHSGRHGSTTRQEDAEQ